MKKTIDFDKFVDDVSRLLESNDLRSAKSLKNTVHDFCRDYKNDGYYRGEELFDYLKSNNSAEASKRLLDILGSERMVQQILAGEDSDIEQSRRNCEIVNSLEEVTRYIRQVCDLTTVILKEERDSTPDQSLAKAVIKLELYWYSKLRQWGEDKTLEFPNFLLNRYNYLFKYINSFLRCKGEIFTKDELKNFKEHVQTLQEVRKVYKYREDATKDIVEVTPFWGKGHHKLEVVENMGAAFDEFLVIIEAGSQSGLSTIAKYVPIVVVASLIMVANAYFALPIFTLSALVSCFIVASYFALCDYKDYQLRKTYLSEALSAVHAEVVNMLPCYEFVYLDQLKQISMNQRNLVVSNKTKEAEKFNGKEREGLVECDRPAYGGTYYAFFSSRLNRSFVKASRQGSSELQLDKVGPDLTKEELDYIQAELDALTDPTQREEMEANLKDAGVPFNSKAPSCVV